MISPIDNSTTSPGVLCSSCGVGLVLDGNLNEIPHSLDVTCPMCGETKTYQRKDIQIFEAITK